MAVIWTEEQQKVIDTRDCNILVSAAAGSGKTAVLVARILKMITDEKHPVDIDRLLVVTFTNAAAAEMRERIRDALEKKAEEEPDNVHLQRQLVLVHNARITTIHSFCLNVLRSHFQSVGIDPSFRIADEGEVLLLEQDAVKETVEAAYEAARVQSDAKEFLQFLESYASGKNDRIVEDLILQVYHFALGQPWPKRWLQECRDAYGEVEEVTNFSCQYEAGMEKGKTQSIKEENGNSGKAQWESQETGLWGSEKTPLWMQYIIEDTAHLLEDIHSQAQEALRIASEPDGPYPYIAALESDLEKIEHLINAGPEYDSYAAAFRNMGTFARLSTKKDDSISPEKKQIVQNMRGAIKDGLASVHQKYYYDRPEVLQQEFRDSGACVRVLTKLTEDFMDRLNQMKLEKNLLDFGDLEHLALQVLVEVADDEVVDNIEVERKPENPIDETGKKQNRSEKSEKKARSSTGYSWRPTAAAREYAELFVEVMTDEYQDSNLVQELILNSVAGRGKNIPNRFMVGDVKQSIYRFRLARPELFMEKYESYRDGAEGSCRIDLHRNFRSRPEVLESINRIFEQIMTKNPGGIVYDADAALYPGAKFEPKPFAAACVQNKNIENETLITECSEDRVQEKDTRDAFLVTECYLLESDSQTRQQEEARLVGSRIREIVEKEVVWDKELGNYRPAQYRDIVILLRTVSGWADSFGEVLTDMGIPCFTGSQKGYFSATEIRVILSYLQILDNPMQDIPLAAVLHSAIGGFDEEDLARIRIGSEKCSFYDCCQEYRREGSDEHLRSRLEQFFTTFEELRRKCDHIPVHLLLWEILEVTGYGDYAAALPAGSQRKANLDMLVEKAIDYEATSYRGLYHFVRYIENLKKYEVDYGEANTGSEAADTVRIMSIHKSKGLEFPIVFVSGMGKQFNESDLRSRVIMHPEYGIGCEYVDLEKRTRTGTLLKRAIAQKTASENLGEELRVLYVAMTRAKEKLILTGSVSDTEKSVDKWKADGRSGGKTLSYSVLTGASTYFDWVMPVLLREPGVKIVTDEADEWTESDVSEKKLQMAGTPGKSSDSGYVKQDEGDRIELYRLYLITDLQNISREQQISDSKNQRLQSLLNSEPDQIYDKTVRDYLEKAFSSSYPHEADRAIVGKLSVSELKKLSHIPEEDEAEELYQTEEVVPLIPQFRSENEVIGGAARGTVYHTFMENLDFSKTDTLEIQLEELISCGKMSREEGLALNLKDIRRFLQSKTGKEMAEAAAHGRLYREHPFVLGVPANEIRPDWNPQETVLVQGIIDAYYQTEEGTLVLLDYKTDRVWKAQELVDKYHAQLEYYSMALKRLSGRSVSDRVIYSFSLGKEIHL